MRKEDLFKLPLGTYELRDHIGNYYYTLIVGLNRDGSRYHSIREKGSIIGPNIFMTEEFEIDEEDVEYKKLSATAGVGGIYIHSDETFSMLNDLEFVNTIF